MWRWFFKGFDTALRIFKALPRLCPGSIPGVAQRFQFGQPHRIVGCEGFFEIEAVCDVAHHLLCVTTVLLSDYGEGVDQFAKKPFSSASS